MKLGKYAVVVCVGAVAVVMATVPAAAQAPISRIVSFGASLSDSGNAFALRGGTNTAPAYDVDPLLVPSSPYSRGGHHFTNGGTWVEQFARSRGLAGPTRPAFLASTAQASNYAVGGARAYDDGINVILSAQVEAFLQHVGRVAPPSGLYTIEMGGNDIRDALTAFATGGDGAPILQAAIGSIAANIGALYGAGARNFLVWRAPNVGLTPAIASLGPVAVGLGAQLTQAFNAGLDGAVAQLSALPGISIARLDAYQLLAELVAHPAAYGLRDVTAACITPNVAPFACQ